jgi:Heme/copper-type cytochrome/quinol oxidases, subunit 1
MKFLLQPKGLLLVISLLIILFGLLTAGSATDFHLHDTYFIVSHLYLYVLIGVFFLVQTAIYFLTDNYRQWRSIQYFHVAGAGFLVLVAIVFKKMPVLLLAIFTLGHILFIFNLITGFIRGKKVLNHVR